MPVTAGLVIKLRDALGEEAANDLISWIGEAEKLEGRLVELRAGIREDLAHGWATARQEVSGEFARLRQEMNEGLAAVRQEMARELASVRQEMNEGLAAVRQEMARELANVRQETAERIAVVQVQLAGQRADLIRWMFIFWAGTVIPLAGLIVALQSL
jgi:DNA anti-recombination protein RmuC